MKPQQCNFTRILQIFLKDSLGGKSAEHMFNNSTNRQQLLQITLSERTPSNALQTLTMYSSCWLLALPLATRFWDTVGGGTLICPCSWDWQVSLCPVWDVSDRYFAADEMRMQKFKSASGISLVICGQHKGRARCLAGAALAGAAVAAGCRRSTPF